MNCSVSHSQSKVELQLQTLVDTIIDQVSSDPIHNAVLLVEHKNFKWKGASGIADGISEIMT